MARMAAVTITLAALLMIGDLASGEPFVDVYAGGNLTERKRFSVDGTVDGNPVAAWLARVRFDDSFTVGGRIGYWLESWPFIGVALGASHFRPDIKPQQAVGNGLLVDPQGVIFGVPIDINGRRRVTLPGLDLRATTLGLDLMLRWPLMASTEFPHGRLSPYLTVGPAVFFLDLDRFRERDLRPNIGVEGGGGVSWLLTGNVGVFIEYRFTYDRMTLASANVVFKSYLYTHHGVAGISFRY